jgi:HK97 family phage prohead protease
MLTRSFLLRDAEVGGDGRSLILACVPFDRPALVDDGDGPYREVFRRGAFAAVAPAANRIELRYGHRQDGPPYGFGLDLVEDPEHLIGRFRVAPGAQGDQVLALVNDGQLNGVSIGYLAGQSRDTADGDGPLVERLRVKQLAEVSLIPSGTSAYVDARVLAVRGAAAPDPMIAARIRARALWSVEKLRYMR